MSKDKDALLSAAEPAKDVYSLKIEDALLRPIIPDFGFASISEAIEVPPLTEAITEAYNRNSYKPPQRVTPVVDVDAERAAFEEWITSVVGKEVRRTIFAFPHEIEYWDDEVQAMWQAVLWRASRG
jgi:hypothetical protein